MRVIGFCGSPRREGNTAWTMNRILEGAAQQGAQTQIWYSSDVVINPCRGCLGCVKSGTCVVNDDMQELYRALEQADALVLGSPVYMGQMSAQAKLFTDRLFAFIKPRFSPRFTEEHAGKKLVLVFTQGNPDCGMFQEYFDYTKKMFKLLEFEVETVQVVAGLRTEQAAEREDLPATLKSIGSSLAARG